MNVDAIASAAQALADACRDDSTAVLKSEDEQRFLLLVAYPAMKADVSKGLDGHRDFGAPDVIEKAAWSFMRKGAHIGFFHAPGYEDQVECVESYIWRGDPWTTTAADGSSQTVMKGDWLIGVRLAPQAWQQYKKGVIGGASPQGRAVRRQPTAAALARLRK